MIEILKGNKPIFRFGNGDVDIYCFLKNGKVYLGMENDKKKDINKIVKNDYKSVGELVDNCDGLMEFSNVESINVVINQLQELKFLLKGDEKEIIKKGYIKTDD